MSSGETIMFRASVVLLLGAAVLAAPASHAARPCGSLTTVSLPNTTITLAASVPAGQFTPPDGAATTVVAFCRVSGVSHPTSDSEIKFEVWMPDAWNGNFDQGGNGGGGRGVYGPGGVLIWGLQPRYAAARAAMGHPPTGGCVGHP